MIDHCNIDLFQTQIFNHFIPITMITRSLAKLVICSPTPLSPTLRPNLVHHKLEYLILVPQEILAHLFSYLSLSDIGQLCLTGSPMLRDRVLIWINTVPCSRRIVDSLPDKLDTEEGFQEWVRRCKQFGVL